MKEEVFRLLAKKPLDVAQICCDIIYPMHEEVISALESLETEGVVEKELKENMGPQMDPVLQVWRIRRSIQAKPKDSESVDGCSSA